MTVYEKYKLVPLNQSVPTSVHKILQRSEIAKLSALDESMSNILQQNISETIKARLYEEALQKFQTAKGQIESTFSDNQAQEQSVSATEQCLTALKNIIPNSYKNKAIALFQHLVSIPEFTINDDSSYTYKGVKHSDANIVELIHHLMKPKLTAGKQPSGFKSFVDIISLLNTPATFIPHKKRYLQVRTAKRRQEWLQL